MTMRCFEEDKMLDAIVWLGEYQQLWRRGDNPTGAVELAELALLEARRALAMELDALARGQRSAGSRTVH